MPLGAPVLPHQRGRRIGQRRRLRRPAELRLPAGRHRPLRLGLGARHGRPSVPVAGGAGLQADPLARRRPAGRRPVPVGRGRVPQGRRVRRVPRRTRPGSPCTPSGRGWPPPSACSASCRCRPSGGSTACTSPWHGPPFLGAPPMRALFESLVRMSDDAASFMAAFGAFVGEMTALGYPVAYVARDHGAVRRRVGPLPRSPRQHPWTFTASPTGFWR